MNQFIATAGTDMFEVQNLATSGNAHPAEWFYDWITGGQQNDAGVAVNGYTMLTHCPLWQGINIIAGDLGQVPIRLMRNEFEEQRQHNAWRLLRVRPNSMQTPSVFIETIVQWAIGWGNGVAYTPKVGSRITEMIPLRPDCLWPWVVGDEEGNQYLTYNYTSPTSGRQFVFLQDEVIHIQGLTGDGVWGYALHDIAKNTIGHGLALQKHGNKFFSNGARPSGILQHPGKLSDEARKKLRGDWEQIHGGVDNAGKVAILWEGVTFNATAMTNIDAQWVEAKKLDRVDAASLLNLPAHKLNALEDSSVRANLEEQNETYKQMTLTRWANRIDEEFRRKLLTTAEWMSDEYRFVFDWDAFMRADIDTLTTVGDRCVKAEIMNRNEARRMIRLPPYEGGEKFGSPAINPQESDPEPAQEPAEEVETTPPAQNKLLNRADAHTELLLDHLLVFLKREELSLSQAAKEATNFVRWLDEFYGGESPDPSSPPKISRLCDKVLGTSIRASCAAGIDARGVFGAITAYAKSRHAQLLALCDTVTKEQLPRAVEQLNQTERTYVAQGLLATALGSNVVAKLLPCEVSNE